MILDYRILFGQAAAGAEAQKSFDAESTAQAVTTGAAAKACSVEAALRGRGPAKAGGSYESQAPADMELEVPRLSSSSDDSAGELVGSSLSQVQGGLGRRRCAQAAVAIVAVGSILCAWH